MKRFLQVLAGLGVSGGALWLTLRNKDLGAIWQAIVDADHRWIGPYVLILVVIHLVRTWRYGILLEPVADVPFGRLNAVCAVGFMALMTLPFRLGEFDSSVKASRYRPAGKARKPRKSKRIKTWAALVTHMNAATRNRCLVQAYGRPSGKTRALDASGGACWPSWSPDGRRIANVLLAKEPSTIQIRNADGGGAREVAADPKLWAYYPDWSSDAKWIALSVSPQHHEGEDWDLAIVPADGSAPPRKLTTGPGNDRLPDWKP